MKYIIFIWALLSSFSVFPQNIIKSYDMAKDTDEAFGRTSALTLSQYISGIVSDLRNPMAIHNYEGAKEKLSRYRLPSNMHIDVLPYKGISEAALNITMTKLSYTACKDLNSNFSAFTGNSQGGNLKKINNSSAPLVNGSATGDCKGKYIPFSNLNTVTLKFEG